MIDINPYLNNQKIFRNVIRACQDLLINSDSACKARKYLNSRLDKDSQMLWKFGYFPTDDQISLLTDMVSKDELETVKLYYPKFIQGGKVLHGHFADHNLIMPFHNVHGEIIALLGRSLLNEEELKEKSLAKYTYNTGCRKDLFVYGLDKAKKYIIENDFVILTEGQFDCISLHSHDIKNSVALGWANLSRYQMFQIHRYTNNIVIMLDTDEAGQKGRTRIKKKFGDIANIKLISPPKGFKDIDEFFRLSKSSKNIEYVIDTLKGFRSLDG
jgi:DNA primase